VLSLEFSKRKKCGVLNI